MNKIALIIRREYMSRIKQRSFIIMTFLGPLLIGGLLTLAIYLGLSDNTVHNVLVVDETPQLQSGTPESSMFWGNLKGTDKVHFFYTDSALTNQQFEKSNYSDMLVIKKDIVTYPKAELVFRDLPSLEVRSYIEKEVENVIEQEKLKLNNLSEAQYESIKTDVSLVTVDAKKGTTSFKQEQAFIGFAFAVVIYFFIFLYGVQVMRGVMEEKNSRIVEVMISSVKPFQLMMGKIIGIALLGLTQFALWVILTGGIMIAAKGTLFPGLKNGQTMIEQAQVSQQLAQQGTDPMKTATMNNLGELIFYQVNWPLMVGMFIFYFLGGYLLYAALFAAVGSAVDQDTDTQQFMLPITIPLVFGFIIAEFALQNPEGSSIVWASIVPLTSPVVMMVRVAMGFDSGTVWQLLLSMALLIGAFIFTTWLAGRIYRIGILLYGKKVTYKEIARWIRYY